MTVGAFTLRRGISISVSAGYCNLNAQLKSLHHTPRTYMSFTPTAVCEGSIS